MRPTGNTRISLRTSSVVNNENRFGPPYFLIVSWIAFGLVSWLWIATRSSAEEKRLWHRRFIIVAGILFGAFISFKAIEGIEGLAGVVLLAGRSSILDVVGLDVAKVHEDQGVDGEGGNLRSPCLRWEEMGSVRSPFGDEAGIPLVALW